MNIVEAGSARHRLTILDRHADRFQRRTVVMSRHKSLAAGSHFRFEGKGQARLICIHTVVPIWALQDTWVEYLSFSRETIVAPADLRIIQVGCPCNKVRQMMHLKYRTYALVGCTLAMIKHNIDNTLE